MTKNPQHISTMLKKQIKIQQTPTQLKTDSKQKEKHKTAHEQNNKNNEPPIPKMGINIRTDTKIKSVLNKTLKSKHHNSLDSISNTRQTTKKLDTNTNQNRHKNKTTTTQQTTKSTTNTIQKWQITETKQTQPPAQCRLKLSLK